jgi:hypothetical protein
MMKENIFNAGHYQQMQRRLRALQPNAARQWGTMNPAEMLRHCRKQLEFVLDPPANQKVYNTPMRYQPIKWLVVYAIPWPKGSATAPEMDVHKKLKDTGAFEAEKTLLLQALNDVTRLNDVTAKHPLFGHTGKKDWGRIIWKHLDHHLRQFGG